MTERIVGERTRRIEDPRLLRGAGRYAADIHLPGVAAVLTAKELEAAGVRLRK